MALKPGERFGPYEIVAPLGAGGMGEVYRAADTRLNRIVALKVLPAHVAGDPQRRERFEREARAISSLSHPHICALYDVGRDKDLEYLVMEFVEGKTLQQRLLSGPLPVDQALRCATEISAALDHAHRRGVVHRDLKPANIMMTKSGVKVLDFGLAKTVVADFAVDTTQTSGLPTDTLTAKGTILGTLQYMSPEQLEARAVDARADIFALGAVMHEMVTGRRAFEGRSPASVIAAVLRTDPPPLSSIRSAVPPPLDRVVRKCLAKEPDERWQTARDLTSELEWIRQEASAEIARPARSRRSAGAWIAAGVLLMIGIAIVWLAMLGALRSPVVEAMPIEFTISPPGGVVLTECNQCLAVSPDGSQLVFVATSTSGRDQLWVRSLNVPTARPLPGTDNARGPFWSPDGRAVGFFADDKIRKIDLDGTNLQTLAQVETTGAQGATWNRDGIVLFAHLDSGLTRVRIGGTPMPVTRLDKQRGELAHSWPQFLPDGRHFLYRIRSQKEETTGIFLGALDSENRVPVLNVEGNPVQVGPGYLVYGTNGTLFAQPFDVSTFRTNGTPVILAQQVMFNMASARSAFAASETLLAYRQTGLTELRWFDRQGHDLGRVGPPGRYLDPTISPNQREIAVVRIDAEAGSSQIVLIDVQQGNLTPMTSGTTWDRSPIWSPDGGRIAFASMRGQFFEMYQKRVAPSGGQEQLLAAHGWPASWSREGLVAYQMLGRLSSVSSLTGSNAIVPTFPGEQPQLSPDGEWLAYVSHETNADEVYVRSLSNAQNRIKVSDQGGVQPRWRGDGRELFYLAADKKITAVDVVTTPALSTGVPHALFPTRVQASTALINGRIEYDVQSDGERFLMNVPAPGGASPITVVVNWTARFRR